jgi:hypothetical protein
MREAILANEWERRVEIIRREKQKVSGSRFAERNLHLDDGRIDAPSATGTARRVDPEG